MKIAVFSPLPPLKSGIADYNADLLPALRTLGVAVDVFVPPGYSLEEQAAALEETSELCPHSLCTTERMVKYDAILYHIGNNATYHEYMVSTLAAFPGIVVFHDYSVHHLMAALTVERNLHDDYLRELERQYGLPAAYRALLAMLGRTNKTLWNEPLQYPANARVLEHATAVITHSEFVADLVRKNGYVKPVFVVPHYAIQPDDVADEDHLREQIGLSEYELVLASFGFMTRAKQIEGVLTTLRLMDSELRDSGISWRYLIVGEVAPDYPLRALVADLHLEERVVFTDYVDMAAFNRYLRITDVCINLRYPTYGESSGTLARMLGMGKAVIVSRIGSFAEFPDGVVHKVPIDDAGHVELRQALRKLLFDSSYRVQLGARATEFAEAELGIVKAAKGYIEAINQSEGLTDIILNMEGLMETI